MLEKWMKWIILTGISMNCITLREKFARLFQIAGETSNCTVSMLNIWNTKCFSWKSCWLSTQTFSYLWLYIYTRAIIQFYLNALLAIATVWKYTFELFSTRTKNEHPHYSTETKKKKFTRKAKKATSVLARNPLFWRLSRVCTVLELQSAIYETSPSKTPELGNVGVRGDAVRSAWFLIRIPRWVSGTQCASER